MPRPRRRRRIGYKAEAFFFKPRGIPLPELEEVLLLPDEVEALRLKDVERMEQQAAAQEMDISQPTFNRILQSARKKVSDAIINGKAIRIEK